ncbi:hypothetical protein MaudMau93_001431 [Microsporum audouinii]
MSHMPLLINPDDLGRGPLIMALTWTFASLAAIAVALRYYVRIKLSNRLVLDDWLIGAALIFNIISQCFVSVGYHYGFGKHDASLRPDQIINIFKWMWLANTPGLLVAITARLSIAVLLVHLFGKVHRWLKWFLVVVTGLCTILTVIVIPSTFLQTTPVSGNWNPFQPSKRWNPKIYISLAFLSQSLWTFTDLTFVLFPVMIIWRLQMSLGKRIGLILLMSASLLTMSMSILKTISLQRIADQQADPTATDAQYNASLTILWSCLEQAFVIIMGCIPPLGSIRKLQVPQSLSNTLDSIVRLIKPSKVAVMDSHKLNSDAGSAGYTNLEMSKNIPGWAGSKSGAMSGEGISGSQQGLAKGDSNSENNGTHHV